MPKFTYTEDLQHTSDATFRAWGKNFSDALAAAGMVKTANTGQINWATVTRPAINAIAGYEIWAFPDALQATAPIFIKVEYGTSGVATQPRLQFTVGASTDGAGTIGSSIIPAQSNTAFTPAVPNTARTWVVYHDGFFAFFWAAGAPSGSTAQHCLVLERGRDGAGVTSGAGVTGIYALSTTLLRTRMMAFGAGAPTQTLESNGCATCFVCGNPTSGSAGADVQFFQHFTNLDGRIMDMYGVVTYCQGDVPANSEIALTIDGVSRNYLALASAMSAWSTGVRESTGGTLPNAAHKPLIIWPAA